MQVKQEPLTQKLLEWACCNASCLLYLTSSVYSGGCEALCIEKEFAVCERLSVDDLLALFNSAGYPATFNNIDTVVLAMPNSNAFAAVFRKKGVRHVVAFETPECDEEF